jgi:diguanylate cyclase (GGDEF)-like protein
MNLPAVSRLRINPMSGTWPIVLIDLAVVVAIACIGRAIAETQRTNTLAWAAFVLVTTFLVLVIVAVPLRVLLVTQRRASAAITEELRQQNERQSFDARLGRALDMADSESMALTVAAKALTMAGTELSASILLADNSDAHLQTVVSTIDCSGASVCDVATPRGCPAVRNGQTLSFASSDQLDCCPHLVERGIPTLAALCVPVSVVGRATGVVHVVRDGAPLDEFERSRIESVAHQAGQCVGMLRATAQTQLQASTDPLTGLNNRRSMENSVRILMRDDVPFAVGICDLDHFKRLNDTYGHDTGDRALRLFARTLRNTVRAGDLVSRHGGEEFVVVMPYTDSVGASEILDRVRLELINAVSDGRTPGFTVSAGVADTTESGDYQVLLRLADERLMRAKRSGRNRIINRAAFVAAEALDVSELDVSLV